MVRTVVALVVSVGLGVAVAVGGSVALAEIGAGLAWGLGVAVAAIGIGAGLLFTFIGASTVFDRQLARRNELMRWQWELELEARRTARPVVQYRWQAGRILPAPAEEG